MRYYCISINEEEMDHHIISKKEINIFPNSCGDFENEISVSDPTGILLKSLVKNISCLEIKIREFCNYCDNSIAVLDIVFKKCFVTSLKRCDELTILKFNHDKFEVFILK